MGNMSELYAVQFADNIQIGVQQLLSKFKDRVKIKTGVTGKSCTFELIGSDDARTKTARHQKAVIDDPSMTRVTAYLDYKYKARQLDPDDELKVVADPKASYTQVSIAAMNRAIDDAIISAINGNKYTGQNGTSSSALPASSKIAVDVSGSNTGLTLNKLILALEKFNDADVDENINKFMAIGPKELSDLLNTSEIQSADYNTLKALVPGKVVQFMGFNFVLSTRLSVASSIRSCLAWAQDGVGLAIGKDITARVKEMDIEDHLSWGTYASMFIGATRIEDEKVVEIACDES